MPLTLLLVLQRLAGHLAHLQAMRAWLASWLQRLHLRLPLLPLLLHLPLPPRLVCC